MNSDELLAAAVANAKRQMEIDESTENRLIRAFIEGSKLGAKIICSGVEASLAVKQAQLSQG